MRSYLHCWPESNYAMILLGSPQSTRHHRSKLTTVLWFTLLQSMRLCHMKEWIAGTCTDRISRHTVCTNILTVLYYRLALAALHYNENAGRKQAVSRQGQERYSVLFPKYKKGGYIVQKVTIDPTYSKYKDTSTWLHVTPNVTLCACTFQIT